MKRDIATLGITALVLLAQMTIVPIITDYHIILPLIYFVGIIIYSPFRTVLLNAFVIGVTQDNMAVGMYGFHVFTILVLAYIFTVVRDSVGMDEGYFPYIVTAAFLLIYNLVFILWSLFLGYVVFSWMSFIGATLWEIILSVLLVHPFLWIARRLDVAFDTELG